MTQNILDLVTNVIATSLEERKKMFCAVVNFSSTGVVKSSDNRESEKKASQMEMICETEINARVSIIIEQLVRVVKSLGLDFEELLKNDLKKEAEKYVSSTLDDIVESYLNFTKNVLGIESDEPTFSDAYNVAVRKIDKEINILSMGIKNQSISSKSGITSGVPVEILESLERFRKEYPDPNKVAFIMMKFGKTKAHEEIVKAIKSVLDKHGIIGIRADDKQYHDDLFSNVITYLFGCGFCIAVFERIEADDFNPNVSLEVGYMFALKKPVCLLKDKTLETLHTDLVGKLYKTFDPQSPGETIPNELNQWLLDKGII